MMRRYVDASRTFQDILVFLSKISAVNSLSYQYDQMLKKQEGAVGWFVLGEFFGLVPGSQIAPENGGFQ